MRMMPRSIPAGALMIIAAACGGNTAPVESAGDRPSPDDAPIAADTVHVRLGTERRIDDGRLTISFRERVSDDRCPANAVCVRAGEARVRLRARVGASTHEGVVVVGAEGAPVAAGAYRLTVTELHPYPGLYGESDPQPTPWIVVRVAR